MSAWVLLKLIVRLVLQSGCSWSPFPISSIRLQRMLFISSGVMLHSRGCQVGWLQEYHTVRAFLMLYTQWCLKKHATKESQSIWGSFLVHSPIPTQNLSLLNWDQMGQNVLWTWTESPVKNVACIFTCANEVLRFYGLAGCAEAGLACTKSSLTQIILDVLHAHGTTYFCLLQNSCTHVHCTNCLCASA